MLQAAAWAELSVCKLFWKAFLYTIELQFYSKITGLGKISFTHALRFLFFHPNFMFSLNFKVHFFYLKWGFVRVLDEPVSNLQHISVILSVF